MDFSKAQKVAGTTIGSLLGVVGIGVMSEAIAATAYLKSNPPPGRLVDVDGRKLHVKLSGRGSPTVVMDAGIGGWSSMWGLVEPEVARFARVVTYDRAGYGYSDFGAKPRTSDRLVKELRSALEASGVSGPYVLVGSSFGGLVMRLFASKFPEEVVGLVLVDALAGPARPHAQAQFHRVVLSVQWAFASLAALSSIGAVRLLSQFRPARAMSPFMRVLPKKLRSEFTGAFMSRAFLTATAESAGIEESIRQLEGIRFPDGLPVIVLTHDIPDMFERLRPDELQRCEELWQEIQADVCGLSRRSRLVVARGCGHHISIEQPGLVVAAIKEVVASIRAM